MRYNTKNRLSLKCYYGMRGMKPNTGLNQFFKIALIFCTHKTDSSILSFFIYFNKLWVIIGIKTAPSDHESNFKKVASIPCGFNTMETVIMSLHH